MQPRNQAEIFERRNMHDPNRLNDSAMKTHRTQRGSVSRREAMLAGAGALAGLALGATTPAPAAEASSAPHAAATRADAAEIINVGSDRQLFFDRKFIAQSDGVTLAMNPPIKRGPVLKPDHLWEDFRLTSYFTVLQDGERARMYYSCFAVDQWNNKDDPWKNHAFLCYAESKDGLTWEKPDLGIVEYRGSKKNNILLRSVVDATAFIDPTAPADRRYKLLHTIGPHKGGLRVSYSADGIHFTTPPQPVTTWSPDSQQNAFYDPRLKKYVAYLRGRPDMGIETQNRTVVRVEIDDIEKPWSRTPPRIVFQTDQLDPPDIDFYTNAAVKYPYAQDAYFMFPASYHHFDPHYGNDGLLDSAAAASRDGIAWQRPDRRPYVSLGEKGAWDESFIMMGVGLFRLGDTLYQYYNGTDLSHGGTRKESKVGDKNRTRWGWMGALEQRLDGFYSADFPYEGGSLVTPPLRFTGKKLLLNINTSAAGSARVALLQPNLQAIPEFGLDLCDGFMGNDAAHVVSWKGNPDIHALADQPLRLHIHARSAKLYAFQFLPG
jgi:hypothetical protein